jgi:hypothetical protein
MIRAFSARTPAVHVMGVFAVALFAHAGQARPEAADPPIDAPSPTADTSCAALTGSDRVHRENQRWRERRISVREADDDRWELWVRGLDVKAPQLTTLRGFDVLGIDERDGERIARVKLSPTFARLCRTDVAELRVDDSVGHGQRVLAIGPDGLLIARERRLMYVPERQQPTPAFDIVYQSSFRVAPSVLSPLGWGGLGGRRLR